MNNDTSSSLVGFRVYYGCSSFIPFSQSISLGLIVVLVRMYDACYIFIQQRLSM
nr:MAG TPA: hypothetical protein [Caudoviricetes sp.]